MWEPTSSGSLLSVTGLGVQRARRWVLRDLSFELAPGEALGVSGPSGSGKSTLAWALLGLLPVAEGAIRLLGLPWSDLGPRGRRPHRALVQGVFQHPEASLPPHRTGWEILEEPLRIRGRGTGEAARAEAEAMARRVKFPLDDLARRPAQWSGGMSQRLCLARALMLRPRLLVLDEPTAGLDPSLASHLLWVLQGVLAEGTGILLISHEARALDRICGRQLLMPGGPGAPW